MRPAGYRGQGDQMDIGLISSSLTDRACGGVCEWRGGGGA